VIYPNLETIQAAALKLLMQASALSNQPTPAELDSLATGFDAARRTTRQLAEMQQRADAEVSLAVRPNVRACAASVAA
jgi:hypothetical protein